MSSVLEGHPHWCDSGRSAYLFDSFQEGWVTSNGRGDPSPYYARSPDTVIANFSQWERVHVLVGDVYDTLPAAPIEKVAFLHIDLNAPLPEVWALKLLWSRIPNGGVVLLDDFANLGRESQHIAMRQLGMELGFDVLYTATGQGIVVK